MASLEEILDELNLQQRTAVEHGDNPLLIVAGAGTGKTTTLAHRVAHEIVRGVDPARIMLLTFTRRAAAEMVRRVDAILRQLGHDEESTETGRSVSRRVWGGTFHSVATRLLRKRGRYIGLKPGFTILDRSDSEDLMNVIRDELGLADKKSRFPLKGTCMSIYSRCVNAQQRLESALENQFPESVAHKDSLAELFRAYVERKETQSVLDYDDLLLFWRALLADERAGEVVRGAFDRVLVDEYQDTNVLQADLLQKLVPDGRGLTVVGDDAQSIYAFRAATVRNILDFPDQFSGAEVVPLEQNYRSTQPILDVTNRVIGEAEERHAKELWSERKEGEQPWLITCADEDDQTDILIDSILQRQEDGVALMHQAVLFRSSHHSLGLEVELSRRDVPFHKYGGLKFIETAHIKDLLAFLRLAENPSDTMAGMRLLVLVPGIGRKKAEQLMTLLLEAGGHLDAWDDFKVPSAGATVFADLVGLLKRLGRKDRSASDLPTNIHAIRKFYEPLLERKYDNADSRLRDLKQLEIISSRFSDRTAFLTDMALDPPSSTQETSDESSRPDDYLILSTIHSAKGLEWDTVYVIHATDGNIPSDRSTGSRDEIEEERRLFYVALTRAKNRLVVLRPERYYHSNRFRSDAHSYAQLTRFLPDSVQQLFDRRIATFDSDDEEAEQSSGTDGVRQALNDLWSD